MLYLDSQTLPARLRKFMQQAHRGVVPSARLGHLIRAALPGSDAAEHWNAYAHASRTTFPDAGEIRLFPLVQYQLGPMQSHVANQSWFELETDYDAAQDARLHAAQIRVEQLLKDAGLSFVWTKGTALASSLYPERRLRPSSDLDLLMQWDSLPALVALARRQDWQDKLGVRLVAEQAESIRYRGSEVSWTMDDGIELDVGWMPRLPFAYDPFAIDWIFETSAKNDTYFANPTWLLIEAIEHGLNANVVSPIRWVVDALWLIECHGADIDWDIFVAIVARYRIGCLAAVGLSVLEAFTDAIPDNVLNKVAQMPNSTVEMDEFAVRATTVDHAKRDLASMRYNLALRAPHAFYARHRMSPLTRRAGVSMRLRGKIAARNLHSRLVWPVSKRLSGA